MNIMWRRISKKKKKKRINETRLFRWNYSQANTESTARYTAEFVAAYVLDLIRYILITNPLKHRGCAPLVSLIIFFFQSPAMAKQTNPYPKFYLLCRRIFHQAIKSRRRFHFHTTDTDFSVNKIYLPNNIIAIVTV